MTKLDPQWQRAGYTLRLGRPAEAETYYANFTRRDPEGDRFTGSGSFTKQQVVEFYLHTITDPNRYDLLLVAPDGRITGESVLNDIDWTLGSANYRIYLFDPALRNHGWGTWLVTTARDFAFDQLHLHRLGLDVFSFNPRAHHVYQRAGFIDEGRLRDAVWDSATGQYGDDILMGMLASDPRPRQVVGMAN